MPGATFENCFGSRPFNGADDCNLRLVRNKWVRMPAFLQLVGPTGSWWAAFYRRCRGALVRPGLGIRKRGIIVEFEWVKNRFPASVMVHIRRGCVRGRNPCESGESHRLAKRCEALGVSRLEHLILKKLGVGETRSWENEELGAKIWITPII